jgi:hypothetical protein
MEKGYEMYKLLMISYRQSIGQIAAYVVISTWLGITEDIEMSLLTCEDLDVARPKEIMPLLITRSDLDIVQPVTHSYYLSTQQDHAAPISVIVEPLHCMEHPPRPVTTCNCFLLYI